MASEPTKIAKLYDETVMVEFYGATPEKPNRHYYKLDGERLLGVTTALNIINKPGLMYWTVNLACDYLGDLVNKNVPITLEHIETARGLHTKEKEKAATIGTEVHEWVEQFIKGGDIRMPHDPKVLNGVTAFLQWVNEHNVQFLSSERIIYSQRHDYVGQMDAEAVIDGKVSVIDFKTSKRPKDGPVRLNWLYQTAAYQKAAEEEGSSYDGPRYILRFDKETGNFESTKIKTIQKDYKAFIGALDIKKREKRGLK